MSASWQIVIGRWREFGVLAAAGGVPATALVGDVSKQYGRARRETTASGSQITASTNSQPPHFAGCACSLIKVAVANQPMPSHIEQLFKTTATDNVTDGLCHSMASVGLPVLWLLLLFYPVFRASPGRFPCLWSSWAGVGALPSVA